MLTYEFPREGKVLEVKFYMTGMVASEVTQQLGYRMKTYET